MTERALGIDFSRPENAQAAAVLNAALLRPALPVDSLMARLEAAKVDLQELGEAGSALSASIDQLLTPIKAANAVLAAYGGH